MNYLIEKELENISEVLKDHATEIPTWLLESYTSLRQTMFDVEKGDKLHSERFQKDQESRGLKPDFSLYHRFTYPYGYGYYEQQWDVFHSLGLIKKQKKEGIYLGDDDCHFIQLNQKSHRLSGSFIGECLVNGFILPSREKEYCITRIDMCTLCGDYKLETSCNDEEFNHKLEALGDFQFSHGVEWIWTNKTKEAIEILKKAGTEPEFRWHNCDKCLSKHPNKLHKFLKWAKMLPLELTKDYWPSSVKSYTREAKGPAYDKASQPTKKESDFFQTLNTANELGKIYERDTKN